MASEKEKENRLANTHSTPSTLKLFSGSKFKFEIENPQSHFLSFYSPVCHAKKGTLKMP